MIFQEPTLENIQILYKNVFKMVTYFLQFKHMNIV